MFNSYVCLPEGKFNMGPQTLLCGGGISPMSGRKVCNLSDDIVVYYCCCLILLVTSLNHAICTYMDCLFFLLFESLCI